MTKTLKDFPRMCSLVSGAAAANSAGTLAWVRRIQIESALVPQCEAAEGCIARAQKEHKFHPYSAGQNLDDEIYTDSQGVKTPQTAVDLATRILY